MEKGEIVFGAFLVFLILAVSIIVVAKPEFVSIENPVGNSFGIPEHTVQISEGVFSLGAARDVDGRLVEGFMFIDYRRENAKPPWAGQGKDKGESKCYAFLAKGARWKTTEQYITDGVDPTLTETSLNTWDIEVSFDIFGARNTSGVVDGADDVSPDGQNEVMSENLGPTDTIAYTIVWGYFSGPPFARELVEWDVVFNSNYSFGDANTSGDSVMDYQNIATHEFGHALGLGHPPDKCTEETMYRFAEFGETKKQTLESGDIAGIQKLYS